MMRRVDSPKTMRPVVMLACPVFRAWLQANPPNDYAISVTFLDEGLHARPANLRHAIQSAIDRLGEPSVVALAYGLCGNGLHGVRAGENTLVIPRSHDCIALLLGSRAAYEKQMAQDPGSYFLSPGWINSGKNPLDEWRTLEQRHGSETAAWLMDTQYQHYRRLILVGQDARELEAVRPKALEIAEYCARWGLRYEKRLGTGDYMRRLLAALPVITGAGDSDANIAESDFLIIPPGGTVHQSMFQS